MAKICAICKRSMGIMTGKVNFLDGSVCIPCYQNAGYNKSDYGQMAAMRYVSVTKLQKEDNQEYRIKCNTCGHLFCYTGHDIAMNREYLRSAETNAKLGVANALFGSSMASYANSAQANRDLDKVRDFTRCPKCNSANLRQLTDVEFEKEKASSSKAVNEAASAADELKKFKELLDSGIISQEEFNAKKTQLLNL